MSEEPTEITEANPEEVAEETPATEECVEKKLLQKTVQPS